MKGIEILKQADAKDVFAFVINEAIKDFSFYLEAFGGVENGAIVPALRKVLKPIPFMECIRKENSQNVYHGVMNEFGRVHSVSVAILAGSNIPEDCHPDHVKEIVDTFLECGEDFFRAVNGGSLGFFSVDFKTSVFQELSFSKVFRHSLDFLKIAYENPILNKIMMDIDGAHVLSGFDNYIIFDDSMERVALTFKIAREKGMCQDYGRESTYRVDSMSLYSLLFHQYFFGEGIAYGRSYNIAHDLAFRVNHKMKIPQGGLSAIFMSSLIGVSQEELGKLEKSSELFAHVKIEDLEDQFKSAFLNVWALDNSSNGEDTIMYPLNQTQFTGGSWDSDANSWHGNGARELMNKRETFEKVVEVLRSSEEFQAILG